MWDDSHFLLLDGIYYIRTVDSHTRRYCVPVNYEQFVLLTFAHRQKSTFIVTLGIWYSCILKLIFLLDKLVG